MTSPQTPQAEEPQVVEAPAQPDDEKTPDPRQENLLNRLLYRGVLPRYAFPTDVATFYVFDSNRSQFTRPAFRFSPSQGLAIALSQYAPGKEVWIANKRFVSGAIYSPMRNERFRAWQARRLYYECKNCRYACTRSVQEGHKGDVGDCPACGKEQSFGAARFWFRPPGFAHPVSVAEDVTPDDSPAKSYATRAKLDAPTPGTGEGNWLHVGDRIRVHYLREQLLVTNTGPRQEGYTYCTLCGLIEPTALATGRLVQTHAKPYPDQKDPICPGARTSMGVCLGTDFITDILLVSVRVDSPVRLTPGVLATEIALRTLSEVLAKAASVVLDLEEGEVQADYRAALTNEGQSGLEAEIYLYDTLAGGAGFSRRAGERAAAVLDQALKILSKCDCDSSCYRCLRSFKNKFEHDRLDRHLARDLLLYLLQGHLPQLDEQRAMRAASMLAEDVRRQSDGALQVQTDVAVSIPGVGDVTAPILVEADDGRQFIVAVSHPLSAHASPNEELREVAEFSPVPVLLLHDLRIRRSLPSATREVLVAAGSITP
jgi:hypothetical protein